jgi:UDP-3-O-[3-hydroxymyristoyl] glucosamine N-acyltransferase
MRTAGELADWLGVPLEGDPGVELRGVASPQRAGAHDLIYVETGKHAERAGTSAALCVIAPGGLAIPGKTVLRAANPKVAFARAAATLVPPQLIAAGIHATAIVSATARLGHGVAIGPYAVVEEQTYVGLGTQIGAHCVIGRWAWIGEDCRLHPRVTVYPGVRLGHRVEVHAGTVLGSDGFGYAFDGQRYWKFPQIGLLEIGDDVEIGANTTIDRGSLEDTRVESGVKLDNLVHVGHNVVIGEHTVIAAQSGISGSSRLGCRVVLGGQVGVADHCRLEDGAIAGAQAGIPSGKTIRRGVPVWGTPARPLDKFKEQYAWFARLPELAARIRELEQRSTRRGDAI